MWLALQHSFVGVCLLLLVLLLFAQFLLLALGHLKRQLRYSAIRPVYVNCLFSMTPESSKSTRIFKQAVVLAVLVSLFVDYGTLTAVIPVVPVLLEQRGGLC